MSAAKRRKVSGDAPVVCGACHRTRNGERDAEWAACRVLYLHEAGRFGSENERLCERLAYAERMARFWARRFWFGERTMLGVHRTRYANGVTAIDRVFDAYARAGGAMPAVNWAIMLADLSSWMQPGRAQRLARLLPDPLPPRCRGLTNEPPFRCTPEEFFWAFVGEWIKEILIYRGDPSDLRVDAAEFSGACGDVSAMSFQYLCDKYGVAS